MSTVSEIKNAEISVNNMFDWNFVFRTPYDYLEIFLSIGVLLENDQITIISPRVSPMSDIRGTDSHSQTPSDKNDNILHGGVSPKYKSHELDYANSKHLATPSTSHGLVQISHLVYDVQTEIRRKIRDTCLEVAEYLSSTSICDPDHYKLLANAVVTYARKQHHILDYQ